MTFDLNFERNDMRLQPVFGEVVQMKGEDGASAYELAVKNGFEGSETAWLVSLKGEAGAKGEKGDNGADGYTPVKGKDYWTETDRAQMVTDVIAALPVYNGEVV